MPILIKNKLFLIHIPKTGGTSIEKHFNINLDNNSIENQNNIFGKIDENTYYQHLRFNDLNKMIDFDKYHILSVVRNPFDKMISNFHWQLPNIGTDNIREKFEWFVDGFININSDFKNHSLPQYQFLDGIPQNKLILFKFETLHNDFKNYFNEDLKYHEYKSSYKLSKNEYYTKKCYDMIRKYYEKDFETFNYNTDEEL